MVKLLAGIISNCINVIFKIISLIKFNQISNFKSIIYDNIRNSYYVLNIEKKKITFFCPSEFSVGRINSLFTKEPETLDWIKGFNNQENNIFWDIGANIGLYSIYSKIVNEKLKVISFEPSTFNLNLLSRNISINSYEKDISIFPIALSDKKNYFSIFNETYLLEGASMSTFDNDFGYDSNIIIPQNKSKIFGTNIDELINSKILEVPDYIKIDVDGMEHLILLGAKETLKDKNIKSILIELNLDFKMQHDTCTKILETNGFKLDKALNSPMMQNSKKF